MQQEISLFAGIVAGHILWGMFQENSIMAAAIITFAIFSVKASLFVIDNMIEDSEKTNK